MSRPVANGRCVTLLLWLFLLAGCAEPLPVDKRDYIGHWQGEGVRLVLQANGQASYERIKDRRRTTVNGPAHSFSTAGFKIGLGPLSAHFKVQSPPAQVDGEWRMTVDGNVLTRVDLLERPQGTGPSIEL